MRLSVCITFGLAALLCVGMHANGQGKDKKPDKKKAWTDPAEAPIDYQIQGEYAGSKLAAQVVARGDGKFDVYILQGGLPGAGWEPKSKKLKVEAKLDPDKGIAPFMGGDYRKGSRIDVAKKIMVLATDDPVYIELRRVERKSPTLGAKPPEGAIVLFDGKNANEWTPGKMVGDLLGVPNNSKRKFTSFTLHLEFRTPFEPFEGGQGRGNSGVYIGPKEVQVLDSFGLKGVKDECGAIYGDRAPDVNMCLPPLVWQTYDIDYRAGKIDPETKKQGIPFITVRHNGVVVHDNFELKGGANQGNINLQYHNNPVVYRNIWVVEMK